MLYGIALALIAIVELLSVVFWFKYHEIGAILMFVFVFAIGVVVVKNRGGDIGPQQGAR